MSLRLSRIAVALFAMGVFFLMVVPCVLVWLVTWAAFGGDGYDLGLERVMDWSHRKLDELEDTP
jgi:hypothetical protein